MWQCSLIIAELFFDYRPSARLPWIYRAYLFCPSLISFPFLLIFRRNMLFRRDSPLFYTPPWTKRDKWKDLNPSSIDRKLFYPSNNRWEKSIFTIFSLVFLFYFYLLNNCVHIRLHDMRKYFSSVFIIIPIKKSNERIPLLYQKINISWQCMISKLLPFA